MDQKERMLAGLPYKAWLDGLPEERARAQRTCWEYNRLPPDAREERTALLRGLFGKTGGHFHLEQPFHCDLGYNITLGDWFYANYNCVILDVARVAIGENVQFAPNVAIYTAGHPIHPDARNSGYEYGIPVTIGDNVWIGGNTVVLPGVTIGDNAVIGAGSVVTKDVPADTVAAGNPCRVLRAITPEDADYYFQRRKFDVDWRAETD